MENTTTLPVFDITAPYHIKREYYRDGFTAFQKKFVMKRNYVMMALFFVLLVSFVVSAVADPSDKTAYFLMMICLAAIFMLWYNPRKQRRMVLDAVQEMEFEQFTACNDGKVLRIRSSRARTKLSRSPNPESPWRLLMCRSSRNSIWSATARRCSTCCRNQHWSSPPKHCWSSQQRKRDCFT